MADDASGRNPVARAELEKQLRGTGPGWALAALAISVAVTAARAVGSTAGPTATTRGPKAGNLTVWLAVSALFLVMWILVPHRVRVCSQCDGTKFRAGVYRRRCTACGAIWAGQYSNYHGILLDWIRSSSQIESKAPEQTAGAAAQDCHDATATAPHEGSTLTETRTPEADR